MGIDRRDDLQSGGKFLDPERIQLNPAIMCGVHDVQMARDWMDGRRADHPSILRLVANGNTHLIFSGIVVQKISHNLMRAMSRKAQPGTRRMPLI